MQHAPADKLWEGPPLSAWAAWHPEEAARVLADFDLPWCVVGGWAIDLFLGRISRSHGDLEIAMARSDFSQLRDHLHDYRFYSVGDGEVREMAPDDAPAADKHQNWLLDQAANAWRMDVMLEPGDHETWIYRRDEQLSLPRRQVIGARNGIPYLRPEVSLLFKAKLVRAKDEADFSACLPILDVEGRRWLKQSLQRFHPGHDWWARL